jgi:hypothetical protein
MKFAGTTVLRLENGRIAEELGQENALSAMLQLGLIRLPELELAQTRPGDPLPHGWNNMSGSSLKTSLSLKPARPPFGGVNCMADVLFYQSPRDSFTIDCAHQRHLNSAKGLVFTSDARNPPVNTDLEEFSAP